MICRVCDSQDLVPVVDLGSQPWCNHFLQASEVGKEPYYSLRLMYCQDCQTAQLDHTVPKEVMFGNHTYLSGVTQSLSRHFKQISEEVSQRFFPNPERTRAVLDIGSNDGTQLSHYKELGWDVLGIESSKGTAQIANEKGLKTINAFFNEDIVRKLDRRFEVINAAGVFFHLEELHSVTRGIKQALKDDGVFVVQFMYLKNIVENCAFDQIYHEHLLYYTLKTIGTLLKRHDLEMFDCYLSPIHGGSVIGFIGHPGQHQKTDRMQEMQVAEEASKINEIHTFHKFAERIKVMKDTNVAYLEKAHASGKTVLGMGAPVKGNTMLNYFGVDTRLIQSLVEKNPLRKGLFAPGSHIPVIMEAEVSDPPDIYYVLAWNFKEEILKNNKALLEKGVEFYFPVDPDRTQQAKA